MFNYKGHVHKVGDDINTDYIISSRRKRDTINPEILKKYFMEDIDPTLYEKIQTNDILVAGKNFGSGSAMEVAATVIKEVGIKAVVAESFARSFFRNGINNGLLLIEIDTKKVDDGDFMEIRLHEKNTEIFIKSKNLKLEATPLPTIMQSILDHGGITPYFIKNNGKFIT